MQFVEQSIVHYIHDLTFYATTACHDISLAHRGSEYMNPSLPIQYTQTNPHHGTKRSAPTDEIESSSNISTEFKKMRLNNVKSAHILDPTDCSVDGNHVEYGNEVLSSSSMPPSHPATPTSTSIEPRTSTTNRKLDGDDFMTIDDTPTRVYIPDLDQELADIEADELRYGNTNGSFFLPDVEKNISKIPLNVLRQNFDAAAAAAAAGAGGAAPGASRAASEQALVLYRDPTSISVPEEEDAVRKAIIAARRNAREKMKQDHERGLDIEAHALGAIERVSDDMDVEQDDDHMDIE